MRRLLPTLIFCLSLTAAFSAQQHINYGTLPNDNTGDSPRVFLGKTESNFNELYSQSSAVGGTNKTRIRSYLGVDSTPNVQWYGAVGDNVTDDTAAIQSGITAVAGTGQTLVFPQGIYKITSPLTIAGACKLQGLSATIKGYGNMTNLVIITSLNGGTIEGLTFDTDQTGLAITEISILAQNDSMQNVTLRNCTIKGMRTLLRNNNQLTATCTNLTVTGCLFTGDFTGNIGNDTCNILDVRGFDGVNISGNTWTVSNDSISLKLSNSCRDIAVHNNVFINPGNGSQSSCIDAFSDARRISFIGNKFSLTNAYSDIIMLKPTSSGYKSEPSEVVIMGNIFEQATLSAFAAPIDVYGSWGLSDQTLAYSHCTVVGNQLKITAPNGGNPVCVTRGFTHVTVEGNTITRATLRNNMTSIDVSNNRDIVVSGNIVQGGAVLVADNQSNPPGTTYTNAPQTLVFSDNIVRGVPSFGCLWLTGITNQSGLLSLTVTGNSLYPTNGTGATAAIIRIDGSNIKDAVITGNSGASDYATYYKVNGTVVSGNEVYANNSWQLGVSFPFVTITSLTNATVDFSAGPVQYISAGTSPIYFTVTNAVAGSRTTVRVHSPIQANNISFDPAIAIPGQVPTYIPQFGSMTVDFFASASGNTNANVIAYPRLFPDPVTIYPTFEHFQGGITSEGQIAGQSLINLGGTFHVNTDGSISGPQAFNNLTASTILQSDGTKSVTSLANLANAILVNNGSQGFYQLGPTGDFVIQDHGSTNWTFHFVNGGLNTLTHSP